MILIYIDEKDIKSIDISIDGQISVSMISMVSICSTTYNAEENIMKLRIKVIPTLIDLSKYKLSPKRCKRNFRFSNFEANFSD